MQVTYVRKQAKHGPDRKAAAGARPPKGDVLSKSEFIRFSQNFLRDEKLVDQLLDKTTITKNDTVYDIGGGEGVITKALSPRCRTVVCVEVDESLIPPLVKSVGSLPNTTVYHADFLTMPLPVTPYKVFANIPFNISADIVRKFCASVTPPTVTYLIVQQEFARKLISAHQGRNSQLSILIGAQFTVRIMQTLQASDFVPRPQVAIVLIELLQRERPLVDIRDMQLFRDFVVHIFNAFQPSIAHSLKRILNDEEFNAGAKKIGFSFSAKPSELHVEQWAKLFAIACSKKRLLRDLVGGAELLMEQKHQARVPMRRTFKQKRRSKP